MSSGSSGLLLANKEGLTLYTFDQDQPFHPSACMGDCANAWPPLTVTGSIVQPSDVLTPLGAFKRDDGTFQVTIAGQPLYRFSGDKAPGETKGAGVSAFGGKWSVANP